MITFTATDLVSLPEMLETSVGSLPEMLQTSVGSLQINVLTQCRNASPERIKQDTHSSTLTFR